MNPRIWKWINRIFLSGIWVQPFAMAGLIWFFKNVLQGDVSYLILFVLSFLPSIYIWSENQREQAAGKMDFSIEDTFHDRPTEYSSPLKMQNLNEIMRELMTSEGLDPEMVKELTHEETPLYVLTNSERVNGANAIVCPEVLQHVYEELGENYYIMPSSIHEVLLVKESTGLTPDEMKRMVHDVNVSEVRPEELLSFKIFRYDGRKLSVINEERQEISQAKEKIKYSKLLH